MPTIPPGTITDTIHNANMTGVRVEAHLTEPVIGLDTNPLHLDGPLSQAGWLAYLDQHGHGHLPPMSYNECADFHLPLATWTRPAPIPNPHPLTLAATPGHVWGWACSTAHYTPTGSTTIPIRRRPATDVMARYTPDRNHHLSAGPLKARDVPQPATLAEHLTWWAITPNPDQLASMLDRIHGIGRLPRHGNGRVRQWTVHNDEQAFSNWSRRQFPTPNGPPGSIRAPYHHPSRKMPCTPPGETSWA